MLRCKEHVDKGNKRRKGQGKRKLFVRSRDTERIMAPSRRTSSCLSLPLSRSVMIEDSLRESTKIPERIPDIANLANLIYRMLCRAMLEFLYAYLFIFLLFFFSLFCSQFLSLVRVVGSSPRAGRNNFSHRSRVLCLPREQRDGTRCRR